MKTAKIRRMHRLRLDDSLNGKEVTFIWRSQLAGGRPRISKKTYVVWQFKSYDKETDILQFWEQDAQEGCGCLRIFFGTDIKR